MLDNAKVSVNYELKPINSKITLVDGMEFALSLGFAHENKRISLEVAQEVLDDVIHAYCSGESWAMLFEAYATHDVPALRFDDETRVALAARESQILESEDDFAELDQLYSDAVAA